MLRKSLISIAVLSLCGCSALNQYFGLQDDNPVEEAVEFVIEKETGIDVDLTPDSPEVKK